MENKSQKNILVKHKEKMSREQAAILLESIAAKLKTEGSFNLNIGGKSERVEPSEYVTLEIELEEQNGKYELEFELEWHAGDPGNKPKTISIE